jgi:hypothetical protein
MATPRVAGPIRQSSSADFFTEFDHVRRVQRAEPQRRHDLMDGIRLCVKQGDGSKRRFCRHTYHRPARQRQNARVKMVKKLDSRLHPVFHDSL